MLITCTQQRVSHQFTILPHKFAEFLQEGLLLASFSIQAILNNLFFYLLLSFSQNMGQSITMAQNSHVRFYQQVQQILWSLIHLFQCHEFHSCWNRQLQKGILLRYCCGTLHHLHHVLVFLLVYHILQQLRFLLAQGQIQVQS